MKPIYFYRLIVVSIAYVFISRLAYGQGSLDKTTFGKSQNDSRDLANSLVPGKPRVVGKGEKKEEVDPRKLPSKAVKDPKFGGSLVEMGLGSSGDPTVQLQKPRSAPDQDSNAPKPAEAASGKDSKVSKQAETSGEKGSKASKSTEAADGQNKDQKATSSAADEKPLEKEKAPTSKPDDNR